MSEIVSADGQDHINFFYSTSSGYVDLGQVFTETIGEQCDQSNPNQYPGYDVESNYTTSRTIYQSRLSEITFSNGRVQFVSDNTRSDWPTSRLEEIKIYTKESNGTETLLKSYVFGEDYFISPGLATKDHYRLKLSSLTAKDALAKTVSSYGFSYNETITMPHRTSLAQDWWGLYNGQLLNQSLVHGELVNFLGVNYNVGGYPTSSSVRNTNPLTMQACMLNKIIYPTGGYTEFDFETHRYLAPTTTPTSRSAASGAIGNTTSLLQQTIIFTPNTTGSARLSTECSDVTDATPFYSTVKLKKQNDSQFIVNHIYDNTITPHPPQLNKDFTVDLVAGITYELTVMSKGTSTSSYYGQAEFSKATIYWGEVTMGAQVSAGGLRVKEIRDYERAGTSPVRKIYKYGIDTLGYGELLIPEYGISNSRQELSFEFNKSNIALCNSFCKGTRLVISGRPALDLTSLNGAPVVYPEVTVYEESKTSPNGRQIFRFDLQPDRFYFTDKAYNNGRLQTNESWRGGHEVWNGSYNGNSNTKLKEISSVQNIYNPTQVIGTKIGWRVTFEGCGFPSIINNTVLMNGYYFYFHDYPTFSGIKKLSSTSEKNYAVNGVDFTDNKVDYLYDNLDSDHQQLTQRITLGSDSYEMKSRYWYPADYNAATENISSLLSKNIIAIPIKTETYKSNVLTGGQVARPNQFGNPYEMYQYESTIAPAHNPTQIVPPSGYIKKADITYDPVSQQIVKTQPANNISTSYLWGL